MKARSPAVVLALAGWVMPLLLWAADSPVAPFFFVDPDDTSVAAIRQLGDRTIDQAGRAFLLELRHELAEKAPALALGGLHLKHYELPVARPGQPVVTAVRRTSLNVRNPANAPDAADRAALDLIQRQIAEGDPISAVLIQQVTLPGAAPEWRVYRPLVVLKQCLDCHGKDNQLASGVADTLKIFYPTDAAVNYRDGEWRGLFRVSITAPVKAP